MDETTGVRSLEGTGRALKDEKNLDQSGIFDDAFNLPGIETR